MDKISGTQKCLRNLLDLANFLQRGRKKNVLRANELVSAPPQLVICVLFFFSVMDSIRGVTFWLTILYCCSVERSGFLGQRLLLCY